MIKVYFKWITRNKYNNLAVKDPNTIYFIYQESVLYKGDQPYGGIQNITWTTDSDNNYIITITKEDGTTGILTVPSNVRFTEELEDKANIDDLSDVAFSGDYEDLTNTPTIPTVSASSSLSEGVQIGSITINGVTTTLIAPTSGSSTTKYYRLYQDPTNTHIIKLQSSLDNISWSDVQPTITTADTTYLAGNAISISNNTINVVSSDISYNDLNDKPTIPAAQVNSDWNASSGIAQILNKPIIPTKTSDLTNDSGFLTQHQDISGKVDKISGKGLSTNDYTTAEKTKLASIESGAEVNIQSDWNETETTDNAYIKNKPTIPIVNNNTITIKQGNTTKGTFTLNQNNDSIIILDEGGISSVSWNDITNKPDFKTVATSGSYTDLINKPTIPIVNDATITIKQGGVSKGNFTLNSNTDTTINLDSGGSGNVQSDWNQTDTSADDYIKNKPIIVSSVNNVSPINGNVTITVGENNVQSNWEETDTLSDAFILNKPNIPSEVTESTVSGWGFTKNIGTVTKVNNISPDNNGNVSISIPNKTSDLTNDSGFISSETDPIFGASAANNITNSDITNWNNKSDFSGDYNDLTNKPTIPVVPTNISAFTNDVGYLTSHQSLANYATITYVDEELEDKADEIDLTTHTSDNNIHVTTNDKTNWNNKSEVNFNRSLTTGTQIGSITINGTITEIYAPTAGTSITNYYRLAIDSSNSHKVKIQVSTDNQNWSDVNAVITADTTYSAGDNIININNNEISVDESEISYNNISDTPNLATIATTGNFNDLTNTPTTLNGYGITDANITNGVITLGNTTITPLTSHQDISGKVDKIIGKGLSTNDLTDSLKSNYDIAYNHSQSTHAPIDAEKNVQSDWNETTTTNDSFIKNKPTNVSSFTNDAGYLTQHQDISGKANIDDLADVATSGSYNDLSNTPTIPIVNDAILTITQGNISETFTANASTNKTITLEAPITYTGGTAINIDNEHTISIVSSDISYNDISNTPNFKTINSNSIIGSGNISIQENIKSDWNANVGTNAEILNKPTLSTVATSGSYEDLSNKPTIFSGDYNDLTNKPTIPAAQINSDWNSISGVSQILNKPTIPTVGNGIITINQGNTQKGQFTVNQSGDTIINLDASSISINDVKINSTSIVANNIADIKVDGTYNPSTNKIATQDTIKDTIDNLDITTPVQAITKIIDNNNNVTLTFKGINETNGIISQGNGTDTLILKKVAITGSYTDLSNGYELPTATSNNLGGIQIGYTENNRNYAIQLDSNNKAYVNVPWIDTNTIYTGSNSIEINNSNNISTKISNASGNILEIKTISGQEGLYVPSTSYTLPYATRTNLGGVVVKNGLEVDNNGNLNINVGLNSLSTIDRGLSLVTNGQDTNSYIKLNTTYASSPSGGTNQSYLGGIRVVKSNNESVTYTSTSHSTSGITLTPANTGTYYPLEVDNTGIAYTRVPNTSYILPIANENTLGGLIINKDIDTNNGYIEQRNTIAIPIFYGYIANLYNCDIKDPNNPTYTIDSSDIESHYISLSNIITALIDPNNETSRTLLGILKNALDNYKS